MKTISQYYFQLQKSRCLPPTTWHNFTGNHWQKLLIWKDHFTSFHFIRNPVMCVVLFWTEERCIFYVDMFWFRTTRGRALYWFKECLGFLSIFSLQIVWYCVVWYLYGIVILLVLRNIRILHKKVLIRRHKIDKIEGWITWRILCQLVGWNIQNLIGISGTFWISQEPPESHQNLQNLMIIPIRKVPESLESFRIFLESFQKFWILRILCQKINWFNPGPKYWKKFLPPPPPPPKKKG